MLYAWWFLVKYREIITNGLDLASFLLATPEVARYVSPFFAVYAKLALAIFGIGFLQLATVIVISLASVGLTYIKPLESTYIFETHGHIVSTISVMAVSVVALYFIVNSGFLNAQELSTWVSRWALSLGVILFILSRFFAFATSMAAL
jgi:hypothetical protein